MSILIITLVLTVMLAISSIPSIIRDKKGI